MTPLVRIAAVRILGDRRVALTLTTGETREVDLEPLLAGRVFDGIRSNDALFAQVRVDPEFGCLVWPGGADICPDLLIHEREPA